MFQLKLVHLAALSVGLLALASQAGASVGTTERDNVVVKYGDLDLTTDKGQEVLFRRVTFAAKQVCPTSGFTYLEQLTRMHACVNATVARTLNEIGQPMLADRYLKGHTHS
jgi:UrcA family protein